MTAKEFKKLLQSHPDFDPAAIDRRRFRRNVKQRHALMGAMRFLTEYSLAEIGFICSNGGRYFDHASVCYAVRTANSDLELKYDDTCAYTEKYRRIIQSIIDQDVRLKYYYSAPAWELFKHLAEHHPDEAKQLSINDYLKWKKLQS